MNRTALFFQSMILASVLLFGFLTGYLVGWNSAVKSAMDISGKTDQGSKEDFDKVAAQMDQDHGAENQPSMDASPAGKGGSLPGQLFSNNEVPAESEASAKIPDVPFPDSQWSKDGTAPVGESVEIVLKDDGSILYGPHAESLSLVNDKIKVDGATKPLERVVIRPDRRAHFKDVVAILRACEDAHLTQVTFGPAL